MANYCWYKVIFPQLRRCMCPHLFSSGVLAPGGYGERGTEEMILAIKWAREQNVPFLGICLGFQLAVVGWARHVIHLTGPRFFPLPSNYVDFLQAPNRPNLWQSQWTQLSYSCPRSRVLT